MCSRKVGNYEPRALMFHHQDHVKYIPKRVHPSAVGRAPVALTEPYAVYCCDARSLASLCAKGSVISSHTCSHGAP